MKELKLQNLMLLNDLDENIRKVPQLLYNAICLNSEAETIDRAQGALVYDDFDKSHVIPSLTTVDFGAYFNVISIEKWKKYTYAEKFKLKIKLSGKAYFEFYELSKNSISVNRNVIYSKSVEADKPTEFTLEIPDSNAPLIGYKITANSEVKIFEGGVYTDVNDSEERKVKICIATTTFRKEAFITKNIALLKAHVLESEDMKDSIFVHIIDNGRTLNPEDYNCRNLKVTPNPNVGGSGGFAKGMMEALSLEDKPTHVLLMDDDVLISTESLFRSFYLLRIVRPEYERHFISGAMFDYDDRHMQHEDFGYVNNETGSFGAVKDDFDMRKQINLLKNEEQSSFEKDEMYAAWWYCCIPVKTIEENGLPLPLFVRGDDVEYGVRCHAKLMTLDGVCVWHVGFAGKFSASMEAYQSFRNGMVIRAVSGVGEKADYLKIVDRFFWHELWRFAYNNAEQFLDVIDDFMKGPDWLANTNAEDVFKAHGKLNEKMVPVGTFPDNYDVPRRSNAYDIFKSEHINLAKKIWYAATCNGHFWPKRLLHSHPAVTPCTWYDIPARNCMRQRIVAVNIADMTGVVRERDVKRCKELLKRHKQVVKNYKKNHLAVEKQYREASEKFRSWEFWTEYLKNQSKD